MIEIKKTINSNLKNLEKQINMGDIKLIGLGWKIQVTIFGRILYFLS